MKLLSLTVLPLTNAVCMNVQIVFKSEDLWRQTVLGVNESERLNYLLGLALVDEDMCYLLMTGDSEFCAEWELSEQTREWVRSVQALSLEEFAIALWEKLSSQRSEGMGT